MEDPAKDIEQVIVLLTTAVKPEIQKATLLKLVARAFSCTHPTHNFLAGFTPRMHPFVIPSAPYRPLTLHLRVMPSYPYTNGTASCLPISK